MIDFDISRAVSELTAVGLTTEEVAQLLMSGKTSSLTYSERLPQAEKALRRAGLSHTKSRLAIRSGLPAVGYSHDELIRDLAGLTLKADMRTSLRDKCRALLHSVRGEIHHVESTLKAYGK